MDQLTPPRDASPDAHPASTTGACLTDGILDNFARAMQVARFDDSLFDVAAGGDLGKKLSELVASVNAADVDAMLRHQTYGRALMGADLEARINFALARKAAREALSSADAAARTTSERLQALKESLAKVEVDTQRLASVASKAKTMARSLATPTTREALELRNRFDRRCANLTALQASTALTLAQIPVAITHYRALLDRFIDTKTVLFPVWERHALAVVQSPRDSASLGAFRAAARALGDRLVDKLDAAA